MPHSITVDKLSKQYQIGELHGQTQLRDALIDFIKRPLMKRKLHTVWALQDVTFEVKQGEVLGIIGRNGAGKSTLLKVLSKITYPTSGTVNVSGRVASLLEVGTGFHEELTGRENIYLNGSILGMTKREINDRLDQIVAFADVATFIDTPIKRYSSGMRLRLGFSVAAHLDADVLLVDEVLAVGDAEFQKKCLKAMDDLSGSGRTVLLVSHNMLAVENLCPRTIWVDKGSIRQDGATSHIIKEYMSTFTRLEKCASDLSKIEDRRGTGNIQFTGIEYLTSDKRPKQLVRSGDSFIVRLHYRVHENTNRPHFGLEIYTELGVLVTEVSTWAARYDIDHLPRGCGYIDVNFDFVNLMPARYYLTLWIASVGRPDYDILEHCAVLDIEPSDVYNSGRGIDSRHGTVFFPCHWHLNAP
ncbi:MAG: ABC transporter ATP-binding protein [Thermodesulfobacteriota bacterium]|nr:ABC transporter ATP-binding protein [Thermodesulfobacteriota bacterium]